MGWNGAVVLFLEFYVVFSRSLPVSWEIDLLIQVKYVLCLQHVVHKSACVMVSSWPGHKPYVDISTFPHFIPVSPSCFLSSSSVIHLVKGKLPAGPLGVWEKYDEAAMCHEGERKGGAGARGDLGSISGTDLFIIMISRHHRSLFLSLSSWRHCFIAICSSVSWKKKTTRTASFQIFCTWRLSRARLPPNKRFQKSWATHYISLPAFPDSVEEKAPHPASS